MPIEAHQGSLECQAAMFVFKDDGRRKKKAWRRAKTLANVRCELHTTSDEFLEGTRAWGEGVDPLNAFLAVYAHMGEPGMAPTPHGPVVTWRDFADALPRKVHTLWLAGCTSEHALSVWKTPNESPVLGSLLITSCKEDWMPLVELFAREVDLDDITFFDEMEMLLRNRLGTNAVTYLDAREPTEWRPHLPRKATKEPLTSDEIEQLGVLLWGT